MIFMLGISEEEMQQRLYGPEGWTLDSGVWNVASRSEPDEEGAIVDGKPTTDYVRFNRLGSAGAQTLLDNLPAEALKDKQNCGPELERLLKACAAHQDKVLLSGYCIAPERTDERITVDAVWVSDELAPELEGLSVKRSHDKNCHCKRVWEAAAKRFNLNADTMPDDITHRAALGRSPQTSEGWYFWWD